MKHILLISVLLLTMTTACADMLSDEEIVDGQDTQTASLEIGAVRGKSKSSCRGYGDDYELCHDDARKEAYAAARDKREAKSGREWSSASHRYNSAKRKRAIAERGIVAAFRAKLR